jgi:ribosomal protein S18 acetylase RimI-like enzyme
MSSHECPILAASPDDAHRCAALHAEQIAQGFLASLGPGFLECLYRRIVAWPGGFVLVARTEREGVLGFVAGTSSTKSLYLQFLLHDAVRAAIAARRQLLPRVGDALETWRYSMVGPPQRAVLPPAELVSMAVDPAYRGQGIGGRLVQACLAEFEARGITAAKVTVGSANRSALGLYQAAGFRPVGHVEVHRGQRSQVLAWQA